MPQVSSGTSASATSVGGVTAIAATAVKGTERHARVVVEDAGGACFVSFDGGANKHRCIAGANAFYDLPNIKSVVLYSDGSDLAAVYASLW